MTADIAILSGAAILAVGGVGAAAILASAWRRREAEARLRAEAASDAKTRMLAHVSHEFRTPLNGILGMSGLLLDSGLTAEQATYARAIRSSSEAFLRLVEEILAAAKGGSDTIEIAQDVVDLPALLEGAAELLALRAHGKGLEIATHVGRAAPAKVRGDADRLRQVLVNLIGNAVKFTETGGLTVGLDAAPGGRVRIEVDDSGPGIPPDRAEAIFEEFTQVGSGPSRREGSGLGLAITRRLVERMGGTIALAPSALGGTCFRVDLDLPPVAAPSPGSTGPALDVLVVTAAPTLGQALAASLADDGHRPATVRSAEEALAAMGQRAFDTILVDLGHDEPDIGLVAEAARRHRVGRSIILLSPLDRRDFGSPQAAGFDGYLIKPVRRGSLRERIAAKPQAAGPIVSSAVTRPGDTRSGPLLHVLLAEDNEINALVATRTLQKLNATTEWVRDGREAVDRIAAALAGTGPTFDLVLMDIRMPRLDGEAAVREIRQLEARQSATRLPVVALTASPLGVGHSEDAGFDRVLGKPFSFEELAAILDEARGRRRAAPAPFSEAS